MWSELHQDFSPNLSVPSIFLKILDCFHNDVGLPSLPLVCQDFCWCTKIVYVKMWMSVGLHSGECLTWCAYNIHKSGRNRHYLQRTYKRAIHMLYNTKDIIFKFALQIPRLTCRTYARCIDPVKLVTTTLQQ